MRTFHQLFPQKFPILAMLHLKGTSREEIFTIAQQEIKLYYQLGVDAIIVEDYFGTKEDVERALTYLDSNYSDRIYGVNILRDFESSYQLALKYHAQFIQIDSVSGHLKPEDDLLFENRLQTLRRQHNDQIIILGGVRFKYQPYLSQRSLEEDLRLGQDRAHAIVVTGEGTGLKTPDDKIDEFRSLLGAFPLIVGAGITPETLNNKLHRSDGAIVGSYFKDNYKDNGYLDASHVLDILNLVHSHRQA